MKLKKSSKSNVSQNLNVVYKCLYYPWIDISKEGDSWLKTSALFWDEIHTIVPESIENPYTSDTAHALEQNHVLNKFTVNNFSRAVYNASESLQKMLLDGSIRNQALHINKIDYQRVHVDKLRLRYRCRIHEEKLYIPIHIQKMNYIIEEVFDFLDIKIKREGDYLRMPSFIANMFMTSLANHICEDNSLAPITSNCEANNVLMSSIADTSIIDPFLLFYRRFRDYSDYEINERIQNHIVEGALLNLTLDSFQIDKETPIDNILEFKQRYHDELCEFRYYIKNVGIDLNNYTSLSDLKHDISEVYIVKVKNSYNKLLEALKGHNILTYNNAIATTSTILGATSFSQMIDANPMYALAVGLGISVIISAMKYNEDKRSIIDNSPLAYLYRIKNF